MHSFFRPGALLLAAAILLPGCGSPQSRGIPSANAPWMAPDARPQNLLHVSDGSRGKSWMLPEAKNVKKLLYISDFKTNDVFVYNYETRALMGQLTGFSGPYGQCVDRVGDIWIAEYNHNDVVEYAHGGTKPLDTLPSGGTGAIGCSVAPNGDLAVANFGVLSTEIGTIAVFKHASGKAREYSNGSCFNLYPPGYDNRNNLYVVGEIGWPIGNVCELRAAGHSMKKVSAPGDGSTFLLLKGGVMWDGKYLTLTGEGNTGDRIIYRVTEAASGDLTFVGQTVLSDNCDGGYMDVVQPFIVGTRNTPVNKVEGTAVVGGDLWCSNRFDVWKYPAGGDPIRTIPNGDAEPYGSSVSIAP
ncbi:MAG TPA: hypothetical protein VKR56_11340 [Candidatus Cybelea sp.]|nr:hypothetical protein [Candidatus Cybelea sp.]